MNNINAYILSFFNKLEIYEDINNGKDHKKEILDYIMEFLDTRTTDSANKVYEAFFRAYWIGIQANDNPFLKLQQTMKKFEETAGCLIEKQRDHYVHTVFVFITGLAIFDKNQNFEKKFNEYALDKKNYPDSYNTKNEEFFYRWGLASLFHDIAYPLQITLEQAKKYLDFVWGYPSNISKDSKIIMELSNFEKFINLPVIKPDPKYKDEFIKKYHGYKFHKDAILLLSQSISSNFSSDIGDISTNLYNFIENMKENNFIDHGFYSAVIMLRWYYYLVKTTNWNPSYFYFPVVDSASAILLHNYYRHQLMKKPFNFKCMKVKNHPIAYLLILCDELQEWNRKSFGEIDSSNRPITDFNMKITDSKMEIYYKDGNTFKEKTTSIYETIKISDLFKKGIIIKHGRSYKCKF